MSRDFFNGLLGVAGERNEFAGAPQRLDPLVVGPDESIQIGPGQSILPPGIIRRFDPDGPESDNSGTGNDSDLLSINRRREPFPEVLFRIGNGECCHGSEYNLINAYIKILFRLLIVFMDKAERAIEFVRRDRAHPFRFA
jgi:hypothetical protein